MPAHPVGPALGRKVAAECAAIQQALAGRKQVHGRVHEARKAIRRVRALLALVERKLDVEAADRVLQRVGDGLSALRDAYAATDVSTNVGKIDGRRRWSPVTALLRERADHIAERVLIGDPGFLARRRRIEQVAIKLQKLPWESVTAADIRKGLQRQCKRTDKAGARAKKDPSPDHLHRWRRRTRRLRMQFDGLSALKMKGLSLPSHASRKLHRLTDSLGWHQDLQVLKGLVRRMPGLAERNNLVARLQALEGEIQEQVGEAN